MSQFRVSLGHAERVTLVKINPPELRSNSRLTTLGQHHYSSRELALHVPHAPELSDAISGAQLEPALAIKQV